MDKIFINAKLETLKDQITIPLPLSRQEIEDKVKELGFSDLENINFFFETNLPEEFTNYIDYGCFITENNGRRLVNLGREYTRYEKLKLYNEFAICLNDLYDSDYGEDYITRFIYAYAEHSSMIIPLDSIPTWHTMKDSEIEFGCGSLAFLKYGSANILDGQIGFWDYTNIGGDVYTLGAWDIDEYEGEGIDDYDDDPVAYLEAIADSYELYINEDERYILDLYYESKEVEDSYAKQIEARLIELGY